MSMLALAVTFSLLSRLRPSRGWPALTSTTATPTVSFFSWTRNWITAFSFQRLIDDDRAADFRAVRHRRRRRFPRYRSESFVYSRKNQTRMADACEVRDFREKCKRFRRPDGPARIEVPGCPRKIAVNRFRGARDDAG